MVLIKNNIQKINPNKHFVSFKKSEDNKSQENKKVPSASEIALGATAIVALGVATVAIISSHKNKKAYEKILDEKISKKIEEKSTEIIDAKVTQKINEKTDKILDNKIMKAVENKFDKDFYNKFLDSLKLFIDNTTEELRKNPKYKELKEEIELLINGIEAWKQEVDRKLGVIDTLSSRFNIGNFGINSLETVRNMFLPNFFR